MPSYVLPLVPLAVFAMLLGRWLGRKQKTIQRRARTAGLLLCVALGVAIAAFGWPSHLTGAEDAAPPASQPAEAAPEDAGAAEPVDAAEPAPTKPLAPDAAAAKPTAEPKTAEAPAEPQGEQAGVAEEKAAEEAEGEAPRIESWWARSVFNLALMAILAAVVIGPFYWALGFTKSWRQPLWGWPIGLLLFGVAAVAAVLLLRWVFSLLPPVFGEVFQSYLDVFQRLWMLWVAVALVVVPVWLGAYLSRRWRMPDYSGKIAVVFFALFAGIVITVLGWPPKLGIDLSGGVILIYRVEEAIQTETEEDLIGEEGEEGEEGRVGEEEAEPGEQKQDEPPVRRQIDMDKLIQAIRLRADPGSMRELTIRPRGERLIEVIIPLSQARGGPGGGDEDEGPEELEELERIKRKISSAGTLEFRILANRRDHGNLIELAMEERGREVRNEDGTLLGSWVRVAKGEEEGLLEIADSAEAVYRTSAYRDPADPEYEWTEFLIDRDPFDVTGEYLADARPSIDQSMRPCVLFTFNQQGGQLFGRLTGNNLPTEEGQPFRRHLGIILDGYLQSAPSIRTTIFQRGEIIGDFTRQEVEDLVDILNAGSLPAALSEKPVREARMGPGLGQDTIDRGKIAIGVSMALVLLFMLLYYRFAGIVACGALLMNLLMILAIMISVRAAFTLPGLAGLVLTVGMAVDANVLIFERIREELAKQAALRMAIRNGFGRATSAIVDANLTTLITATVLYVIGTDQIKGFAVTLWLGVVLSMFTAIYCSRVVFDVAERQKWITELKMRLLLRKTQIDFLGMRRPALAGSVVVIVIGLAAVFWRGSGLLDIDFTGGVSIQAVFNQPQDIAEIRNKLGEEGEGLDDLSVMDVQALGQRESGMEFVINTTGPQDRDPNAEAEDVLAEVKTSLQRAFGDQLAHHSMTFTLLPSGADRPKADETTTTGAALERQTRAELSASQLPASQLPAAQLAAGPLPGAPLLSASGLSEVLLLRAESSEPQGEPSKAPQGESSSVDAKTEEPPAKAAPADTSGAAPREAPVKTPPQGPAASAGDQPASGPDETAPAQAEEKPATPTRVRLEFEHRAPYETLSESIRDEIRSLQEKGALPGGAVDFELFVDEPCTTVNPEGVRSKWFAEVHLPPDQTEMLLGAVKQKVESEPVFPSSNTIGGQVALGMRVTAVWALLISLVCIVGYIWIRFQRVMFGLAAVAALVHDVLVTLGVIALTAYVAPVLGWLGIDEFKIGLAVWPRS
jgi:SecD/SecF fusion protein